MKSDNPYKNQSPKHFWKTGVSLADPLYPSEFYTKKWSIFHDDKIATAGSCFAQHIGKNLKSKDFMVLDKEPPPKSLDNHHHTEYGYGLYSARYGNIYTVKQLLQLAEESFGLISPRFYPWEKSGRYYDALRPGVEPEGFCSTQEMSENRIFHLDCVRQMFKEMDVFVFTLGLTEAWIEEGAETAFPTAPGVIAGNFHTNKVSFNNFTFNEIMNDFIKFMNLVNENRESLIPLKILLTVSPVPLTATATVDHVLLASTYSKSVLRAVAGQLSSDFTNVDYFPSYEIISNCFTRGVFYENNLRTVTSQGVNTVMKIFFLEHRLENKKKLTIDHTNFQAIKSTTNLDDIACEEQLLESFLHEKK